MKKIKSVFKNDKEVSLFQKVKKMEINKTFETYITLDEREFKAEIEVTGDLISDKFDHAFGADSFKTVNKVFIVSIYDFDHNMNVSFKDLSKKEQRHLLSLAEEELNDEEMWNECLNEEF